MKIYEKATVEIVTLNDDIIKTSLTGVSEENDNNRNDPGNWFN